MYSSIVKTKADWSAAKLTKAAFFSELGLGRNEEHILLVSFLESQRTKHVLIIKQFLFKNKNKKIK